MLTEESTIQQEILFYPDTHKYVHAITTEEYISVTTLISKYKKAFNSDLHSKRVAAREGVPQQVILDTWKQLTQQSHKRGNTFHKVMEVYLRDGYITEGFEELVLDFGKKINNLMESGYVANSEYLLYNNEWKVAGTADLVLQGANTFCIIDFKTNKKFGFYNKYGEYFLEPIEFLPYCEYTMYSLQLSLYAYLQEQYTGKKCKALKIYYLREGDQQKYWQEISVIYMKDTIEKLLKHYEQSKQ